MKALYGHMQFTNTYDDSNFYDVLIWSYDLNFTDFED